ARRNVCHHPDLLAIVARFGQLLAEPGDLFVCGCGACVAVAALVVRGLENILRHDKPRVVQTRQHHAVITELREALCDRLEGCAIMGSGRDIYRDSLEEAAVRRLHVISATGIVVAQREEDWRGWKGGVKLLREEADCLDRKCRGLVRARRRIELAELADESVRQKIAAHRDEHWCGLILFRLTQGREDERPRGVRAAHAASALKLAEDIQARRG